MIKKLFIITLALCLSSCATLFHHQAMNDRLIILAPNNTIKLPAPNTLLVNKNVTQILTATYRVKNQTKTLSAQVEVEKQNNQLTMVAVAGWGGQIFSITDNGQQIITSSLPMPNAALGVKHVLADFMLTYLPTNQLRKTLASTKIKLAVKKNKRLFLLHGKKIITIHYQFKNPWRGTIILNNAVQHYTIRIQTL